jgi:hypothetical protein
MVANTLNDTLAARIAALNASADDWASLGAAAERHGDMKDAAYCFAMAASDANEASRLERAALGEPAVWDVHADDEIPF